MNPVVSILIPSRNRTALLARIVRAFRGLCKSPEQIQIIIRLDLEDKESVQWAENNLENEIMICHPAKGYAGLMEGVNAMAACAKGKWIWPATDDMEPLTKDWDELIAAQDHSRCCILYPAIEGYPRWRVPIISRALYESVGHVGLSSHGDCYIDALAGMSDGRIPIGIKLNNLRPPDIFPKDRELTWEDYRGRETVRRFELDKKKIGAVTGRRLGSWNPSMCGPLPKIIAP